MDYRLKNVREPTPLGIFSDIGSDPNPYWFIVSFIESTMEIAKIKKSFPFDVPKNCWNFFKLKLGYFSNLNVNLIVHF